MKYFNKKKYNKIRGFTLIEMVFYVAIFGVFSLVTIDTMILMTKSFNESQIQADIIQGSQMMERIIRETRSYDSPIINSSTDVTLVKGDGSQAVGPSAQFSLSSGNILFTKDNVFIGNLNSPNISVSGLTFTQITTANSKALKIYFALRSTRDRQNRTYDFYGTAVLRGSY